MDNQWYDIDSYQWISNDEDQWGFTTTSGEHGGWGELYQVWTDESYVYAATISGLDIISIETETSYSYVSFYGGFTSVWASDNRIFVGTNDAGIKVLSKEDIIPGDITVSLEDYVLWPDINSNNINYLHGNDSKIICCTLSGVDIIRRDSFYITHYLTPPGFVPKKCFVTPKFDYFYYTLSGTEEFTLNMLRGNTSNWILPDVTYKCGEGFLSEDSVIYDMFVTEHTTISGGEYNTLFLATDKAVVVYDEGTKDSVRFVVSDPASGQDEEENKRKALIFGDYWREKGISGAYCDNKRIALIYGYY